MPFGLIAWLKALYARIFPEREIYVRSEGTVRYLTLTPGLQFGAMIAMIAVVVWAAFATVSSYVSDTEVASRDQALIEVKEAYTGRVVKLQQRYKRLEAELEDSERRFDEVMRRLSGKHGQLENQAGVEVALQGRLEASRRRLQEVTEQRDDALTKLEELRYRGLEMERGLAEARRLAEQRRASLDEFVQTLDETTTERDDARQKADTLSTEVAALETDVEDIRRHQAQVMAQLEEATKTSIGELERILKKTGINLDSLVSEIERSYSGEGGPFIPIAFSVPDAAEGFPVNDEAVQRALVNLQYVNTLRLLVEKVPLAEPITDPYRVTSGFGKRRHPVTGRWAMHNGYDMAAPKGTPVLTTMDGRVSFAGTQRGYGKVVRIQHALGFETRYAHLSAIHVSKGDSVTRGMLIGDVGSTGRSTGNHLHYEIRLKKRPYNPRKFLEAGKNVF
ncbi:MAG: DUF5930 domain-containing protein [Pseudomonadota bacterium]